MMRSLTGLHLWFLAVLLIALSAIGYLHYESVIDRDAVIEQQRAMTAAQATAGRLNAHWQAQRTLMSALAQATHADAALKARQSDRERREKEILELLPTADQVSLVAAEPGGTPIEVAGVPNDTLDHVRHAVRTETLHAPRIIAGDAGATGYVLIVPLGRGGQPPAGYLFARFSLAALKDLVNRASANGGYLALTFEETGNTKMVVAAGEKDLMDSGAPIVTTVAKTGWSLLWWPRSAGIATIDWRARDVVLVLAALALIVFSGFRLWRHTVRSVRHDVMSLLRMFKDVREGTMRVDYPMRLNDFSDVYHYLRNSGRKMLKEKKRLKTMGLIDHLSQLSNRRHFEMRLKELFELSKTHGPSSVLIIDVDHFKRVNDQHGHDAGDALITAVASALRGCIRQSDLLARLGGDEFCVIYPYTTLERAVAYADRLRRQLPREVPLLKGVMHELRWTGGLSVMTEKDTKFDDVLWRADQALIQAKEAGRNCMRVFDPAKGLEKKAPMAAN